MGKSILIAATMLVCANTVVAATPTAKAPAAKTLQPSELAGWPRMRATDFGCMLEKRFGADAGRFGCAADYDRIVWSDGCAGGENYNVGPELPVRVAKTLPAPVESVSLDWEHGDLRSVTVYFDRKLGNAEIEKTFGVRIDGSNRDNLMSVSVDECATGKTCLSLDGFEHIGGADLEEGCVPNPAPKAAKKAKGKHS